MNSSGPTTNSKHTQNLTMPAAVCFPWWLGKEELGQGTRLSCEVCVFLLQALTWNVWARRTTLPWHLQKCQHCSMCHMSKCLKLCVKLRSPLPHAPNQAFLSPCSLSFWEFETRFSLVILPPAHLSHMNQGHAGARQGKSWPQAQDSWVVTGCTQTEERN